MMKEKSSGAAAAPIIVPIVLKMAEFDHKVVIVPRSQMNHVNVDLNIFS